MASYDFREARILDLTREDALKALGFPPNANPSLTELKAAQRTKALEAHPDRGGSIQKMQDVNRAFDFLKNAPAKPLETGPAPGSPSRPGPQDDEHWYGGGQQKAPEPVVISFDKAKAEAKVPSDVEWQFVTDWQRSPLNFSGGESSSNKSAFVAYGRKVDLHLFVVAVYYNREFPMGATNRNLDIWGVQLFRYVIKDPTKESQNPAWLTAQVTKALKFYHGELEFEGKFNNKVRDAKDWKFGEKLPPGNSTSIKHWLVESGQVEGSAPSVANRKNVIELKLHGMIGYQSAPGYYEEPHSSSNFWGGKYHGDFFKVTVVVNGKDHDLDEKDTQAFLGYKVGGKKAPELVFGTYWHQGGKKNLNRLRGGKGLLLVNWFADNAKSLPDSVVQTLKETAATLK
jgi:hypothetical protein